MHFWSAREVGLFDTPFGDYYVKFIAHFVSVYERTAPPFARESARWSSSEENIAKYLWDKIVVLIPKPSYLSHVRLWETSENFFDL